MENIRIAVLHFSHETVTFLGNDTQLSDFVYEGSPCRDEALLSYSPKGYMGGFVQCAREFAGVELVGIESPLFPKTGIGSGWVTQEAFEHFVGRMLQDLQDRGPFDGVYLSLHGAMAVRDIPRPEAELAQRVRQVVGPDAVLAATLDLHANEDESFFNVVDLTFSVKYYPHYDMYLQGERAARTLVRTIRGSYQPESTCVKVPILSPTVMQWTGYKPWMELIQRALMWEAAKPDVYANVLFGFPWADTPDAGMTIQVTANGDANLSSMVARNLAEAAWRNRKALLSATQIHGIEAGWKLSQEAVAALSKPVVLADHSDRSGAATWVLAEGLRQGVQRTLFASIMDFACVTRWLEQGVQIGDWVEADIGGRVDASAGTPVRLRGHVIGHGVADDGAGIQSPWVSLALERGNAVIVSAYLMQFISPQPLQAMGLRLTDYDIYVIKSRVHFRMGFEDSGFAARILLIEPDAPFLGTTRLEGLPYQHLRLQDYYPYGRETFAIPV